MLDYYTRGTYDEYWDRIEHNYTRYWDQHADIPATFSTGWYDPFPAADSEYFASMTEKNSAPAAARDRPVEPRRHARRRHVLPRGRLRPPERLGRAALLRGAARLLQPLASRRRPRPAAGRGAGPDLRDGRRLRPQDGRRQARPRRALARGAGVAARAGRHRRRSTSTATAASRPTSPPPARRRASSPSTRRTRCRRSAASTARSASCRPTGRGWSPPGRGC